MSKVKRFPSHQDIVKLAGVQANLVVPKCNTRVAAVGVLVAGRFVAKITALVGGNARRAAWQR